MISVSNLIFQLLKGHPIFILIASNQKNDLRNDCFRFFIWYFLLIFFNHKLNSKIYGCCYCICIQYLCCLCFEWNVFAKKNHLLQSKLFFLLQLKHIMTLFCIFITLLWTAILTMSTALSRITICLCVLFAMIMSLCLGYLVYGVW